MPDESGWNMYVFRDGKVERRGSDLLDHLVRSVLPLYELAGTELHTALMDSLIRAGELECALCDAGSDSAELAARVTDLLADALVTGRHVDVAQCTNLLRLVEAPENVRVAPPEGFAFYALHPLKFADLAREVASSDVVAIVGIRSIGTTLSAVVFAALRSRGMQAERRTVRPIGHPYDRHTEFNNEQLAWIAKMNSHRAQFLVVDEGPGMSGSSLLSVSDALLSAGVGRANIALLCSRIPDPSTLKAKNASERWPSFNSHCINGNGHLPERAERYVGGGIWRGDVFSDEAQWPASWTVMERAKYLSLDGREFYKFEGLGSIGAEVHERACKVAEAGFGPAPLGREEGYGVYRMVRGRTLTAHDATPALLKRVADYCAFRAGSIPSGAANQRELEHMIRFNAQQEFGADADLPGRLELVRPVITDSRMAPHKWIECDGAYLKVDSATHGDDHFFPGPTDIAWDLAGAIVEWDLDHGAAHFLLNCYRRASGDDAFARVRPYVFAYAVFRMAFWKMAAAAMWGTFEERRLLAAYQQFRQYAANLVPPRAMATDGINPANSVEIRVA